MNRIRSFALAALAVASVGAATAGVASAQSGSDEDTPTRQGYVGVVTDSSTSTRTLSVRVKASEGGTSSPAVITFQLTDDSRVKIPGAQSKVQVSGALEAGAKVAVLGERMPDGTWTAIQILVKPNKPTLPPATGSVVSVENGVMTLMLPNGKVKMIEIGEGQEAPGPGDVVTAFAPEGSDGERPPKATGLVKASEVHERLKKFLDETEADGPGLSSSARSHRIETAAKLADLIEQHAAHRVQLLEGVLGREGFPEKARTAVENALQKAKTSQSEAGSKADGVRGRLDLPKGGKAGPGLSPTGRSGQ